MSMQHKAFTFHFEPFSRELEPILERALKTGDCPEVVSFIELSRSDLTDPYEGEPFPAGGRISWSIRMRINMATSR